MSGRTLSQESIGMTIGDCKDVVDNLPLAQEYEKKDNTLSLTSGNIEPSSNYLKLLKMF